MGTPTTFSWLIIFPCLFVAAPALTLNAADAPPAKLSDEDKRSLAIKYLSQADASIDKIDYMRYRVEALSLMADTLLQAGDKAAAQKAFARAIRGAREVQEYGPGNGTEVWTAIYFAKTQAQIGDLAGAEETIASIQDKTESQSSKVEKPGILARAENLAQAQQAANALPDALRDEARVLIARAIIRRGDLAGTAQTIATIGNPRSKDQAAATLAIAYGKAGDAASARITVDLITNMGFKQKALIAVAKSQTKAGRNEDARQTLRNAKDIAEKLGKLSEKVSAWCNIAVGMAESGDGAAASHMLDEATEMQKSVKPEPSPFGGPPMYYNPLPVAYASIGEFPAAIRSANGDEGYLGFVREYQADRGDINPALHAVDLLKDNIPKNNLLLRIARAQTKAGDLAGARTTLARVDGRDAQIQMQARLYHGAIARAHVVANDLPALDRWAESCREFPVIHAHILIGAARGLVSAIDDDSFEDLIF